MARFAPEDIARHYDNAHARIVGLVRSLTEDEAATPVPCLPGWTVHDVVAHLAANTTDGLAGRITGIPDDEFTAGQVRERKAATIEELLAEWAGNLPQMIEVAHAGLAPPQLAVDAVTHEQDIREALQAPLVGDRAAVRFSLDLFGAGVAFKMNDADVALHVRATDSDYALDAGSGGDVATLRAAEFDLFRTFAGRRTRAEVLAMEWDGDGTAYLSWLNIFGAVPDGARVA
jgi:uncharacterized protein (TIGR03083 family)